MKKMFLLLMGIVVMSSCSSDDSGFNVGAVPQTDNDVPDDTFGANDLVGLWTLTDLRIDSGVSDLELALARDIVLAFRDQDCDILTFDFATNNTYVAEDKINYLEENITIGEGGLLMVECPEQTDTESAEWTFSGSSLTLFEEGGDSQTIPVIVEDDNTILIPGEVIDESYAGADGVFVRQ